MLTCCECEELASSFAAFSKVDSSGELGSSPAEISSFPLSELHIATAERLQGRLDFGNPQNPKTALEVPGTTKRITGVCPDRLFGLKR